MNNNYSRNKCNEIAKNNGWKKESIRNVVEVNGEKWSFSVHTANKPECRQTYEDTVGFIGYELFSGNMVKYRVNDFSKYRVSRISPSGIKAYNVVIK